MDVKKSIEEVKDFIIDKANDVKNSEVVNQIKKEVINVLKNDDEFFDKKLEIFSKIKEYNTIIIHRHIRPDGDAIGSSLGLRELIKTNFPEKEVYSAGGNMPENLKFIGTEDVVEDSKYDGALAIVVDTSNSDRVYDERFKKAKEIIKIDHHFGDDNYGTINYVRSNYASCSMVITDLFASFNNKYTFSKEASRYLFIATVTDSGRFRYSEVDSNTFKLTSKLMEQDINTQDIYTNLYTKDMIAYKFQGYVYDNISFTDNGVAYLYISKKIMKKYKISREDASNTVNLMDGIRGSMIWLLFIENDEEIRIRMRSRYISILGLAGVFGGGGHENACGANVKSKKEIDKVLKEADKVLKEFKKNNPEKF